MKKNASVARIIGAIVTALVVLSMLGVSIFALTIPHWGLFGSCLAIAVIFGIMSYRDIKYFFFSDEVKSDE